MWAVGGGGIAIPAEAEKRALSRLNPWCRGTAW